MLFFFSEQKLFFDMSTSVQDLTLRYDYLQTWTVHSGFSQYYESGIGLLMSVIFRYCINLLYNSRYLPNRNVIQSFEIVKVLVVGLVRHFHWSKLQPILAKVDLWSRPLKGRVHNSLTLTPLLQESLKPDPTFSRELLYRPHLVECLKIVKEVIAIHMEVILVKNQLTNSC